MVSFIAGFVGVLALAWVHAGEASNPVIFDDQPLTEALAYPDWFKLSFLDLPDDLREATGTGKAGLMVYFGQKHCAYCKAQLETNFSLPDIVGYTRRHFDVVGIDIHGSRMVKTVDGRRMSEKAFARALGTNFTPSIVFYDRKGRVALRLRGYYPPYKYRAALEYVADGHYLRERFRDYLARADVPLVFSEGELNYENFFEQPPFNLDRSRIRAQQPLLVMFEQAECHACDVLHTGPLSHEDIRSRLQKFDVVQLGLWDDTPVVTPGGRKTTARNWANQFGLFYTPTLVFFDRDGHEIIRIDSVVQFYRLRNVLDYILTGAWRQYPDFQQWRMRAPAQDQQSTESPAAN